MIDMQTAAGAPASPAAKRGAKKSPRQWLWRVFNLGWPRGHEDSTNEWGEWSLISDVEARRLARDDKHHVYEFVRYEVANPNEQTVDREPSAGAAASESEASGPRIEYARLMELATAAGIGPREVGAALQAKLEVFARSVEAEYLRALGHTEVRAPVDGFQGDYLEEVVAAIREDVGDRYADAPAAERIQALGELGLKKMIEGQKETLARTVLEKAERACLISNSLNAVRELQPAIEVAAAADA